MATNSTSPPNQKVGIIILGNSGAGKSFICNLLVGENVFASNFQPEAVTTTTSHHAANFGEYNLLIYDIPGLIEANQELIDRNKKEIEKAFEECPYALIIFVWRQTGGRVVPEDIIAFEALQKAYQFPPESLMFVLNNIPSNRPLEFDEKFIVLISKQLKSTTIATKTMFFLPILDPTDKEKMNEYRLKLFSVVLNNRPKQQEKHEEIILRVHEIKMLQNALKMQLEEAEKNREWFLRAMQEMRAEYETTRGQQQKQYEKLLCEMSSLKTSQSQDDVLNSVVAGTAAGAVIGAIAGPVGIPVFGMLGGGAAGMYATVRNIVLRWTS